MSKNINYPLYPKQYFTGTDAYITFNGVPVGEITSIGWQLSEPVVPIFSYSSYVWDDIAYGSRTVTGGFAVNLTESQYIRAAMSKAARSGSPADTYTSGWGEGILDRKTTMIDEFKKLSQQQKQNFINNCSDAQIKKIANEWEYGIWGNEGGWKFDKTKDTYFTSTSSSLHKNGFDIYVMLGNESLDLDKTYDTLPGTIIILNHVIITGVSQQITPDGQVLAEQYSFIARDMNNTPNRTSSKKPEVRLKQMGTSNGTINNN